MHMQCASASAACIIIIIIYNAYLLRRSVGVVRVHTASSRFVDHGVVLPYRSETPAVRALAARD